VPLAFPKSRHGENASARIISARIWKMRAGVHCVLSRLIHSREEFPGVPLRLSEPNKSRSIGRRFESLNFLRIVKISHGAEA
jgi:hypothetical protein